MVLVTNPTFPGCILSTRPIGLLKMLDTGQQDDKILAVPLTDPRYEEYKDIDDLPSHILDEISHMFQVYKGLEGGKEVQTLGWRGRESAKTSILESVRIYEKNSWTEFIQPRNR